MPIVLDDNHLLKRTTQLGVHFTPTLDVKADRAGLEAFAEQVRTTDRVLFNRPAFGRSSPTGQLSVLIFERDIILRGVGQVKHTPLILYPNMLELGLLFSLPEGRGLPLDGQDRPRDADFDTLARPVVRQLWERLAVEVNRIGKVYEFIYGPFEEDVVAWTMERFLRPLPGPRLASATATFVFQEEGYHILFMVAPGTSPVGNVLCVKVDINNADNTQRLEIRHLDETLTFATRFRAERYTPLLRENL